MAATNLSEMTDEQLVHHELSLERELITATFQLRVGELENTADLGRLRKEIARSRTAQRDRELDRDNPKNSLPKNTLRNRYRSSFTPGATSAGATEASESGGFLKGIANKFGIG